MTDEQYKALVRILWILCAIGGLNLGLSIAHVLVYAVV